METELLNYYELTNFQNWVNREIEKIRILELEGFTRSEAIELLKLQALQGIGR